MNFVKYFSLTSLFCSAALATAQSQPSIGARRVEGCVSSISVSVVPGSDAHRVAPGSNQHALQLMGAVAYVSYVDEPSSLNIQKPSTGQEVPAGADVVAHWWMDSGSNVKSTHLKCYYGLSNAPLLEVEKVLPGGYAQCWIRRTGDARRSQKYAYCE